MSDTGAVTTAASPTVPGLGGCTHAAPTAATAAEAGRPRLWLEPDVLCQKDVGNLRAGGSMVVDLATKANHCKTSGHGCSATDFVSVGFDAAGFGAGKILGNALGAGLRHPEDVAMIANKMAVVGFIALTLMGFGNTVKDNIHTQPSTGSAP